MAQEQENFRRAIIRHDNTMRGPEETVEETAYWFLVEQEFLYDAPTPTPTGPEIDRVVAIILEERQRVLDAQPQQPQEPQERQKRQVWFDPPPTSCEVCQNNLDEHGECAVCRAGGAGGNQFGTNRKSYYCTRCTGPYKCKECRLIRVSTRGKLYFIKNGKKKYINQKTLFRFGAGNQRTYSYEEAKIGDIVIIDINIFLPPPPPPRNNQMGIVISVAEPGVEVLFIEPINRVLTSHFRYSSVKIVDPPRVPSIENNMNSRSNNLYRAEEGVRALAIHLARRILAGDRMARVQVEQAMQRLQMLALTSLQESRSDLLGAYRVAIDSDSHDLLGPSADIIIKYFQRLEPPQ